MEQRHNVDMKWGMWSTSPAIWQEYAPEAWDAILRNVPVSIEDFNETFLERPDTREVVTLITAPRKECRYGTVTIMPNNGKHIMTVDVDFHTEWDGPYDLARTLFYMENQRHPNEEEQEQLAEELYEEDLGTDYCTILRVDTLHELLEQVDGAEVALLEEDARNWNDILFRYCPTNYRKYIREEGE